MIELKKCPFCGGESKKKAAEVSGYRMAYIACESCGASSSIYNIGKPRIRDEENPAIKAWNRREPMDKIVERLEEYFDATDSQSMRLGYHHAIKIVKGGNGDEVQQ